jgi:hypothetical protein
VAAMPQNTSVDLFNTMGVRSGAEFPEKDRRDSIVGITASGFKFDDELIKVIGEGARVLGFPVKLLIALGFGESSLNPHAGNVSNIEASFGIFQINVRAHGMTPDHWMGIQGTRNAMAEMTSRWTHNFRVFGGQAAWDADPETFLHNWWPNAQGSIVPTLTRVRECLHVADEVLAVFQPPVTNGATAEDVRAWIAVALDAEEVRKNAVRLGTAAAAQDEAEVRQAVADARKALTNALGRLAD